MSYVSTDIKKIIAEIIENKKEKGGVKNIYFVGCGGSLGALYPAKTFMEREAQVLRSAWINSNEFVHSTPKDFGENSIICLACHKGNTPETIQAAKLGKEKGAAVIILTWLEESEIIEFGDYIIRYTFDASLDHLAGDIDYAGEKTQCALLVAVELLAQTEGYVTEMTILGNDVFADALEERLKEREIPLRILKRTDRPTAAAKMDLVDGDKKHLHFEGNAMEEIELQDDDLEFVKQFDIIYAERWAKVGRYIKEIRQEGQIWVYDFSKRLEQESNDEIIPYLDYAFFSYDRDDEYIRNFMVKTNEKGAKTVVAMLGEYGSLAYENGKFYKLDAEKVEVVNTVGAGDSYIAAFTYGVSLGEDIMQCMRRGRQRATEIIQQFNPYK